MYGTLILWINPYIWQFWLLELNLIYLITIKLYDETSGETRTLWERTQIIHS